MSEIAMDRAAAIVRKIRERPLGMTKATARYLSDVRLARREHGNSLKMMLASFFLGLLSLMSLVQSQNTSIPYQSLALAGVIGWFGLSVMYGIRLTACTRVLEMFEGAGPQNLTDLHFPQITTGH